MYTLVLLFGVSLCGFVSVTNRPVILYTRTKGEVQRDIKDFKDDISI